MKQNLVAYFSASGTTAKLAKNLASAIGAELLKSVGSDTTSVGGKIPNGAYSASELKNWSVKF